MVGTVRRSPIVGRPPCLIVPSAHHPFWTVRRPPHSRVTTPPPPLHQAEEEWRRRAFFLSGDRRRVLESHPGAEQDDALVAGQEA